MLHFVGIVYKYSALFSSHQLQVKRVIHESKQHLTIT